MRQATIAAILLVTCAGTAVTQAQEPPTSTTVSGAAIRHDAGKLVPKWLLSAWANYKSRFIVDGRVIDDVNQISHSEGQGYAMLIAVYASDEAAFQQIWRWTKREMYVRPDGLASWKWTDTTRPRISDPNNATDGDMLIAWALLEAGERWRSADYVDAARQITGAIGRHAIALTPFGPVIKPGVDGFAEGQQPDGPVVNLSYWVFPAFEKLKGLSPEIDWAGLQETGLRLLRNSRFGPMRLPSDWIALGSGSPQPARNFPARFSYNAIRIPLHLAWANLGVSQELRTFRGLWNETLDVGPFEIELTTGSAIETFGGTGFKAVSAVASCATEQRKLPLMLKSVPMESYFPTTLHILSLIILQERYPQCL